MCQPVHELHLRHVQQRRARQYKLRPTQAGTDHDVRRGSGGRIDEDRPISRQPERRDTAVLHPGLRDRVVHRGERRLAGVEQTTYDSIHVSPRCSQHHASSHPYHVSPARGDDDAVGRDVQPDAVPLAERGSVRQVRIDLRDADLVRARPGSQEVDNARGEEVRPTEGRLDSEVPELDRHTHLMQDLPAHRLVARNLVPDSDNKIHDDEVARQFGFTGALVPGVEVFAYATNPPVAAWAEGFLTGGRLSIRFRRPVYDGEAITVTGVGSSDGFDIAVTGADQVVRAVGQAWTPAAHPAVKLEEYPARALPESPPPASTQSLTPGPLGTVIETATPDGCEAYLDGIGETLPLYREVGVVHPGILLRMVNAVLFRTVALGPWIHTSSDARLVGIARVGCTLEARGVVTELFNRNGNDYVRYDAVVLADGEPVAQVDHTAIWQLATAQ